MIAFTDRTGIDGVVRMTLGVVKAPDRNAIVTRQCLGHPNSDPPYKLLWAAALSQHLNIHGDLLFQNPDISKGRFKGSGLWGMDLKSAHRSVDGMNVYMWLLPRRFEGHDGLKELFGLMPVPGKPGVWAVESGRKVTAAFKRFPHIGNFGAGAKYVRTHLEELADVVPNPLDPPESMYVEAATTTSTAALLRYYYCYYYYYFYCCCCYFHRHQHHHHYYYYSYSYYHCYHYHYHYYYYYHYQYHYCHYYH